MVGGDVGVNMGVSAFENCLHRVKCNLELFLRHSPAAISFRATLVSLMFARDETEPA